MGNKSQEQTITLLGAHLCVYSSDLVVNMFAHNRSYLKFLLHRDENGDPIFCVERYAIAVSELNRAMYLYQPETDRFLAALPLTADDYALYRQKVHDFQRAGSNRH